MTPPAPWTPLVLLLLSLASLPAEGSDRDSPSCTEDLLTVPRGQPAVMSCAVSTPLAHVAIRLSAPGKASQLIFGVDGPGNFSNSGWCLEVRGGEARLVIPDTQPAQAGEYTWYLEGTHRSVGHTRLSVSEPLVTEAASTLPADPGMRPPPPADSTMSPIPVLLAVIVLVLVLTVIAVRARRRRHQSRNLQKVPQVSESVASRLPLHDAEAEEADVPRVGPLSQDTDSFRLTSEGPGGDSCADSGPRAVGLEEDSGQTLPATPRTRRPEGQSPMIDLSLSGSSGEGRSASASSQRPAGLSSWGLLPGPLTSVLSPVRTPVAAAGASESSHLSARSGASGPLPSAPPSHSGLDPGVRGA